MARDNTEVTLLNVKSPASLVSSVFSYWESLPSINGETQQKMWHCCCALGSAIDRGVHLRPYDFATEEAHQDFEDSHQKKGERRLSSAAGERLENVAQVFLVIVDPFNTWLSILLVSTSLIQLHPVSDFASRRKPLVKPSRNSWTE